MGAAVANIVVEALGKGYPPPQRTWPGLLRLLRRPGAAPHGGRWALRDVSFRVGAGESVGVIGRNGAGKSTLLRLLTGTTAPTAGRCAVGGRAAALLDLGLGIHPAFTGRQNAQLTCQLMGMDGAAIRRRLPAIAEFSELGDAFEAPVRTYSTGMALRLAFSVATARRPDVLIVDEALAVGDLAFQHKAMARIRDFTTQGTTLLLVTHDPAALKTICGRALLLDGGALLRDGDPDAVFNYYNAMIAQADPGHAIEEGPGAGGRPATRSGSRAATVERVVIADAGGAPGRVFRCRQRVVIDCAVHVRQAMPAPTIGILLRDRLGRDVFGTNTALLGLAGAPCAAGERLRARFTVELSIAPGAYALSVAAHDGRTHLEGNHDWWDHALAFDVVGDGGPPFAGVAALPVQAVIERDAAP